MGHSRTEARILRDLGIHVPPPEARSILRRGMRIASMLGNGRLDDAALDSICKALLQEGGLVQELVEEFLSQAHQRSSPRRKGANGRSAA